MRRRLIVFCVVGVAACAAPAARVREAASRPAPGPEAAAPSDPPCDRDSVQLGPITAGLSFGTRRFACRIGPSPRQALAHALENDPALAWCLRDAGEGTLEVRLVVNGEGRLAVAEINEGATPRQRACVPLLLRTRAMALGCRWRHSFRHTVFEL